jgi:hypothetical protein
LTSARIEAFVRRRVCGADTPDERLGEYGRLFEHALLRRERRTDAVVFSFRADPDVTDAVSELARRKAACCPFLDYRVEVVGDEVVWTITNTITGDERAAVDVTLDAFHALPDHAGPHSSGAGWRRAERRRHATTAAGTAAHSASAKTAPPAPTSTPAPSPPRTPVNAGAPRQARSMSPPIPNIERAPEPCVVEVWSVLVGRHMDGFSSDRVSVAPHPAP